MQHKKYIHLRKERYNVTLKLFLSIGLLLKNLSFVHGYQFSPFTFTKAHGLSSTFPSRHHHYHLRSSPSLSSSSTYFQLCMLQIPTRLYSSSPKDEQHQSTKNKVKGRIETPDDSSVLTLSSSSRHTHNPRHVAFICDGNSRWAEQLDKNKSSTSMFTLTPSSSSTKSSLLSQILPKNSVNTSVRGHAKGASTLVDLVRHLNTHHTSVRYITVYGFSTENWSRPSQERDGIWEVIGNACEVVARLAQEEGVVVRVLGDLEDERVPPRVRDSLRKLEEDTRELKGLGGIEPLTMSLAINYGGRRDILTAARKMAQLISDGKLSFDDDRDDDAVMSSLLSTSGIPDPDMVIRTAGEQRLSNFLIWNCAYAELYFTDVLWPDFSGAQMDEALEWYRGRERRFGGRSSTTEWL